MSEFIKTNYRWMRSTIMRFKQLYPNLIRHGTSYEPYDKYSMIVRIPGVGKLLYEQNYDKITWLEHWQDEYLSKQYDKEHRPEMYKEFCIVIKDYMKSNCMTHQEFADIVNISRKSLSKYLNGNTMPKVSTMRRICKTIHVDL